MFKSHYYYGCEDGDLVSTGAVNIITVSYVGYTILQELVSVIRSHLLTDGSSDDYAV